jgi:hypothetical protein
MQGGAVKDDQSRQVGLTWFYGIREDINVIFYHNCKLSINHLKEKFHRKTMNICRATHCYVAMLLQIKFELTFDL